MKDRRHAARYPMRLQGAFFIRSSRPGHSIPIESVDLSGGGVFVTAREQPQVGEAVELRFTWPTEKRQPGELVATGRVIRVEELMGGKFGFAVQFSDFPRLVSRNSGHQTKTPAIFTAPPRHEAFQYYSPLKRARAYLEENYSEEEISLDKVARAAALQRSYFSTFFKQKVGINFSDWLRQYRVRKAIELMPQEDHSISWIAYEVGFADLRTFERAFRKYTELAPRDFRSLLIPR